jgi:hypothetical protein
MKARFQADADFSQRIVSAPSQSHPALAGWQGRPFPISLTVLTISIANSSRVLVSHDVTTMPNHFAKFVETNTSAGLLIVRQRISIHRALEIVRAWIETEAEEWVNQMRVV